MMKLLLLSALTLLAPASPVALRGAFPGDIQVHFVQDLGDGPLPPDEYMPMDGEPLKGEMRRALRQTHFAKVRKIAVFIGWSQMSVTSRRSTVRFLAQLTVPALESSWLSSSPIDASTVAANAK